MTALSRRRWIIAAGLFALLLIVATFPMRLALSLSGAAGAGLTSREIRGSVWSGKLVDARVGVLPLGTIDASLSPLALLTGRVELAFSRVDARLGALSGRLHGSGRRGVSDLTGATALAGGLSIIPVDSIRFEGAKIRFDSAGNCSEASGRLEVSIAAPIAGLDLSRGLSGPLSCAQGHAQAALASQSGMERMILTFNGSSAWRARLAINVDDDPMMAATLAALGFKAGPGGFVLTTTGKF